MRSLQASKQGPMTWKSLNVIGQNYGIPAIDFERFSARWDSDPELQQIVDRFNEKGLVLKNPEAEQDIGQQPEPSTGSVETMAKRATKKKRKFD